MGIKKIRGNEQNQALDSVPIEKGGTSARTPEKACENLGIVSFNQVDVPFGISLLGEDGLVKRKSYPLSFAGADIPSYAAPDGTELFVGESIEFYITNYDRDVVYNISAQGGTVSISGDKIVFTGTAIGQGYIEVNDRQIPVVVKPVIPKRPVITSPAQNKELDSESVTFTSSAFSVTAGTAQHLSSDWQISTEADFSVILKEFQNSSDNKISCTFNNLPVGTTIFARVRYRTNESTVTDWSNSAIVIMRDSDAMTVKLYGAGAGGAGGQGSSVDDLGQAALGPGGGGGGSGEEVTKLVKVNTSKNFYITVGIGGKGGAGVNKNNEFVGGLTADGGDGGKTIFTDNDALLIEARGGIGGQPGEFAASSRDAKVGGVGGATNGMPGFIGASHDEVEAGNVTFQGQGGAGGTSTYGLGGQGGTADSRDGGEGGWSGGGGGGYGGRGDQPGGKGGDGKGGVAVVEYSSKHKAADTFTGATYSLVPPEPGMLYGKHRYVFTSNGMLGFVASLEGTIDKPSITSPLNNSVDVPITQTYTSSAFSAKRWSGVHVETEWQISTTPDFSSIAFTEKTTSPNLLSKSAFDLDWRTIYYVRVRYRSEDKFSPWSDPVKFTTIAEPHILKPSVIYPINNTTDLATGLTFTSDAYSTFQTSETHESSDWQVATDANFLNIIRSVSEGTGNKTSFSVTGLNYSATYFVRVRYRSATLVSEWSNANRFVTHAAPFITAPTITSPSNGAGSQAVSLTLQSSSFQINHSSEVHSGSDWQIATDSSFNNIVKSVVGSSEFKTSYTISGLSNNTTYYARVRYRSATMLSAWSAVSSFTTIPLPVISTPSITSPSNNATGQSNTLTISASPYSMQNGSESHVSSDWQIATDSGFNNLVFSSNASTVNKTSWTPGSLSFSTGYYVRVRYRSSNYLSNWSSAVYFTTMANPSFTRNYTIASNTLNFNLRDRLIADGWNGTQRVVCTITVNSGVYLGSSSTSVASFVTGVIPSGSDITLINNGNILGRGGDGGAGATGSYNANYQPGPGQNGGPAINATGASLKIQNNGIIGGGGGGGGGGGQHSMDMSNNNRAAGGGGGGGQGYPGGNGGGWNRDGEGRDASPGSAGSVSSPGGGGAGTYTDNTTFYVSGLTEQIYGRLESGNGGNGGSLGQSGTTSATQPLARDVASGYGVFSPTSVVILNGIRYQYSRNAAGGNGGPAVIGNANITWLATGIRYGAIS